METRHVKEPGHAGVVALWRKPGLDAVSAECSPGPPSKIRRHRFKVASALRSLTNTGKRATWQSACDRF